jgi:hypothetical protein
MSDVLIGPLIAAVALAAVVVAAHRRLPPAWAARVLALTLTVLLLAALPTVWIVGAAYLIDLPAVHTALGWCAVHVGQHHGDVPAPLGLAALLAAVAGTARGIAAVRDHRRLRCAAATWPTVAADDRPFAYTLPGPGGQVVVSTGLVELLDEHEQAVVLAHEHAHGACRHDRFVLLARVASGTVPLLRPITDRLLFSLERWADEHAVAACGDRHIVASTLTKVALSSAGPHGALAFQGVGIAARVSALRVPPVAEPAPPHRALLYVGVSATAALAAYQLHHLVELLRALCAG